MITTYAVRIWRIRPGENAGDYASLRSYDETRYLDLPDDVDEARAELLGRGILNGGDTFKLETKERT